MVTRPHKPAGKVAKRSRHTVAAGTGSRALKHDARGEALLLERDVQRVLGWLSEAPLRTITSEGLRQWMAQQSPEWTPGYCAAVKARVQEAMTAHTSATVPEARARLLGFVDGVIPETREVLFWKKCDPIEPAVKDPRTPQFKVWRQWVLKRKVWDDYMKIAQLCADVGMKPPAPPYSKPWGEEESRAMDEAAQACPLMTVINHSAVQGYLKLVGQLTGALSEEHRHLHLHANAPPEELSDDALRARIAQARPVDHEVSDG